MFSASPRSPECPLKLTNWEKFVSHLIPAANNNGFRFTPGTSKIRLPDNSERDVRQVEYGYHFETPPTQHPASPVPFLHFVRCLQVNNSPKKMKFNTAFELNRTESGDRVTIACRGNFPKTLHIAQLELNPLRPPLN